MLLELQQQAHSVDDQIFQEINITDDWVDENDPALKNSI